MLKFGLDAASFQYTFRSQRVRLDESLRSDKKGVVILKGLSLMFLFLLSFLNTAYGNLPTAPLDIYSQLSLLKPGTDISLAYEIWGEPKARMPGDRETSPAVVWQPESLKGGTVFVSLEDGNKIEGTAYTEIFTQKTWAVERYEKLKKAFCEFLGEPAIGNAEISLWYIDHYFVFSADYAEADYDSKRVTNVTVSFFAKD
jgi:hypothetical protein